MKNRDTSVGTVTSAAQIPDQASPFKSKLNGLLRNVGIVAGGHAVFLLLTAVTGICLVRWLPVEQYALYTVVFALFTMLNLLADSGLAAATTNEARRQWQSPSYVSMVVASGRRLRRMVCLIVYPLSLPLGMYMLHGNGYSIADVSIVLLLAYASSFIAMESGLFDVPLRLHQANQKEQTTNVVSTVIRATAIVSIVPVWPTAIAAMLAVLASQLVQFFGLRRAAGEYAHPSARHDPHVLSAIGAFVKSTLPVSLYFSFSGQIAVWLASIFSDTEGVAAIGGLGRLGHIFGMSSMVFGTVFIPRFARLTEDRALVTKRLSLTALVLIGLTSAVILPVMIGPQYFLWLLGNGYANYPYELRICALGAFIYCLYAGMFGLATARGWIVKPQVLIPISIAFQVLLILLFDASKPAGILWISGLGYLPALIANIYVCIRGIQRMKLEN
ncbi:MAG TPA: oligosaccharide flippase family protein [Chryseolinea sp.]